MRHTLSVALTAAVLPAAVHAQWLRDVPGAWAQPGGTPAAQAVDTAGRPGVAGPVVGGLLGGGIGLIAGAMGGGALAEGGVGSWSGCDNEDLGCLLSSILIGAAIGEAALLPAGAHLGSGGRGSLAAKLLVSAGIAAVGVAVTAATVEPAYLIPVPVFQLWAVTHLSRNSTVR
ncbi:MAG TPA: hypothetical protein VD793_03610 [Gemmatimonadales bacterium]|nr:hypothetical protein [Gemmatimonadales bacterium]